MSFIAQVRHLLLHDLRRQRWMLAFYALSVAMATTTALSFATLSVGWLSSLPAIVFVTALLQLAFAVQADSPWRPDAFWVSRPIAPAALLSAKLLLALTVVALPIIALTATLAYLGFPASELGETVRASALSFAGGMLVGMALASVTRDIRGFINALAAIVVLSFLSAGLAAQYRGWNFEANEAATRLTTALLYAGPLAMMLLVYGRRDAVRLARFVGVALMGIWVVLVPFARPRGYPVVTVIETLQPQEAPRVALVLDPAAPGDEPGTLRFHVRGDPWRDATRFVVGVRSLLVHANDGTSVNVQRVPALVVRLRNPIANRALFVDAETDSSFTVRLSYGESLRLKAGIKSVELIGTVTPYASHVAAVLPFRSKASHHQGGTYFQIDSVQRDPAVAEAVATTVSLRGEREDPITESQTSRVLPRYVMIDDSMNTAIRLSSSSGGTSSVWMIVPRMTVSRRWTRVQAHWPSSPAGGAVRPVRLAWLEWQALGQAPVHLTAER